MTHVPVGVAFLPPQLTYGAALRHLPPRTHPRQGASQPREFFGLTVDTITFPTFYSGRRQNGGNINENNFNRTHIPLRRSVVKPPMSVRQRHSPRETPAACISEDGNNSYQEHSSPDSPPLQQQQSLPPNNNHHQQEQVSLPDGALPSTTSPRFPKPIRQPSLFSMFSTEQSLVSASGFLQVDDGSLSESDSASFVVHHLRRKSVSKVKPSDRLAAFFSSLRLPKSFTDTAVLGALFVAWYWSNTVFNVYNKQVLKVFPFPLTCTLIQFFVAALLMGTLWLLRIKKIPKFTPLLLRGIAPLGVLHAAGFLLTNMSLGKVSVAFTHTVKSTEPFFSVLLTPSILGIIPTWGIIVSLFPIVAGVALASATEASFSWIGFLSAIGSNIALQSRNALSKKLMTDSAFKENRQDKRRPAQAVMSTTGRFDKDGVYAQSILPIPFLGRGRKQTASVPINELREDDVEAEPLDNVNLFATMTMLAFLALLPVSILVEGSPLLTQYATQAVTGMSPSLLVRKLGMGGICRCLDVLVSYMILQRVSPVTHSVGNCVKRAVVIAFSIVVFKTKVTMFNIFGTLLALAGVFLYSVIVSACKQNYFGPDSPVCKPIYEPEVELVEGAGI